MHVAKYIGAILSYSQYEFYIEYFIFKRTLLNRKSFNYKVLDLNDHNNFYKWCCFIHDHLKISKIWILEFNISNLKPSQIKMSPNTKF